MLNYGAGLGGGSRYAVAGGPQAPPSPGSLSAPLALTYETVSAPAGAAGGAPAYNSPLPGSPQRRRVAGAPASSGRRRVSGAPTPDQQRQRRASLTPGGKLVPLNSPGAVASPFGNHRAAATSPAYSAASPAMPHRVSLGAGVASPAVGGASARTPGRRRVAGAPSYRRRKPSAIAAAATALQGSDGTSVTEENMARFRREMDKMPAVPGSPKGTGWGRVKTRVQWQEGDSCAVCMTNALTGRLKPCGHRSMCEACYREVLDEGRGVYCPKCFAEVTRLVGDSLESSDADGGSGYSSDGSGGGWPGLTDGDQARLHLRASRAGTKIDRPSVTATSAVEIAQAFGTGIGTMFLHLGILVATMALLAGLQLPNILANASGMRSPSRTCRGGAACKSEPSALIVTTMGNCGASACNVGEKWFVVLLDAVAATVIGLLCVWARARVAVFERQVGDNILGVARRVLLVRNVAGHLGRREVRRYMLSACGLRPSAVQKCDMLADVESHELHLLQKRRVAATRLRIADAKIEWGDPTSECSGECVSEEEWGHHAKPKAERALDKVERGLAGTEGKACGRSDAFVWFATEDDRNRAVAELSGRGGDDPAGCGRRAKAACARAFGCNGMDGGKPRSARAAGGLCGRCLTRCLGCAVTSHEFPMARSGLTRGGDGMHETTVVTHPALFPANLVHRNMRVSEGERLLWRASAVVLLGFVVGLSTTIYATARQASRLLAAALLLLVNALVPHVVRRLVRQQRTILRSEANDAACALSLIVTLSNVLYFALYSALYSSRDGGVATWEHMFPLQWYDEGGGDVMHYYLLLDGLFGPLLILWRSGWQKMRRATKLRRAVCQEQLNQVHVGIQLDFLCEYTTALVSPAVSIVLCMGLPLLPLLATVGLLMKTMMLRHVLFFEAAVPLWRDGSLVKWGCGMLQVAVLAHFLMASAMLVSADQTDAEAEGAPERSESTRYTGLYAIHPLCFLAMAVCMASAKIIGALCCGCLLQRATRVVVPNVAPPPSPLSSDGGTSKLPQTKEAREALKRVRQERKARRAADGSGSSSGSSTGSSSSDEDDSGEDSDDFDLTNADEFAELLRLLDAQAARAWNADLVVDPELHTSFDAGDHPFFGAEIRLRRSMRSAAEARNRAAARKRAAEERAARARAAGKKKGSPGRKNHGFAAKVSQKEESRKQLQAIEAKKRLQAYVQRSKKIKATRKTVKRQPRRRHNHYGGQNHVV